MPGFVRAATLLALAGCGGAPHPAPSSLTDPTAARRAQVEAGIAVIDAYRLTDATLRRYIEAARSFAGTHRLFPDTLFKRGQVGPTIDDLAAILERDPTIRRALADAGITSREYVIFAVTMLQAAVGAWVVEQQGWSKLPPDVARANVEFYQRHKAQIDSVTADLKNRDDDPT